MDHGWRFKKWFGLGLMLCVGILAVACSGVVVGVKL